MILLQLSSAQGPDECCLAVAKALARLSREAARSVDVDIVESESGGKAGTYRSVLLSLDGDGAASLAANWEARSNGPAPALTVRPTRARTGSSASCAAKRPRPAWPPTYALKRHARPDLAASTSTRRNPPCATHVATGISVKVQTERSQHANKRLAVLLIAHRLASHEQAQHAAQRARRRQFHHEVERGSPKRVFKGAAFEPADGA